MRASIETPHQAELAGRQGYAAVALTAADPAAAAAATAALRAEGRRAVRCPAETHQRQCTNCRLCFTEAVDIIFTAHGPRRRTAAAVVSAATAKKADNA